MRNSRFVAANSATFSAPLPVVVEAVKAAGFDGIEVFNTDLDGGRDGAAKAATLLAKTDMQVPAFQLLRDFEGSGVAGTGRIEKVSTLLDVAKSIGARLLLVCANTKADSSGDRAVQVRDLRILADLAKSKDMRIGFEPLAWSHWISDYELASACVETVDHSHFGLVLDMFHFFYRNTPIKVLDRIPMDKLYLVQLSNAVRLPLPVMEVARHHRLFPADGEWPVAEAVHRLEERGFDGDYSIEVFNDDYRNQDPYETALEAMTSFRKLFDGRSAKAPRRQVRGH